MLSVFGDESHDSTRARVFVVAGLLGDSREWSELRNEWKERLNEMEFHAADCESGYGNFRNLTERERLQLHHDLTRILASSKLRGYGYGVDLAGLRSAFPSVIQDFPDMPYYDCFLRTIKYLSDLAGVYIPRERVEFTFDQHRNTQYNAGLLYNWLSHYRDNIVDKVGFASREELGIQAADLWARELMKRCDTHLFDQSASARPQWDVLMATKRFTFKFILADELAREMEQASKEYQLDHADYESWRRKHNVVDNLSNRFRWLALQDKARS